MGLRGFHDWQKDRDRCYPCVSWSATNAWLHRSARVLISKRLCTRFIEVNESHEDGDETFSQFSWTELREIKPKVITICRRQIACPHQNRTCRSQWFSRWSFRTYFVEPKYLYSCLSPVGRLRFLSVRANNARKSRWIFCATTSELLTGPPQKRQCFTAEISNISVELWSKLGFVLHAAELKPASFADKKYSHVNISAKPEDCLV